MSPKRRFSRIGASLKTVGPPTISLVQTSRMNHPTWPTAHPTRSPAAAFHVPFKIHEKATRAIGRYGAVMVNKPKRDIGVEGWRRDHRYIGTNAREDDRKGRLNNGESASNIMEDRKRSQK